MEQPHVCPWWMGYALILPIRKFSHNPKKILEPYIRPGMVIMDYGSAMGYFSIPLAKMIGGQGKVYCVDIQEKMLAKLQKRAIKYGVSDIIKPLLVGKNYDVREFQSKLDFVLLFAVVHEVPDQLALFKDVFSMLKPGGKVLFSEPQGHVTQSEFRASIAIATTMGFVEMSDPHLKKGLTTILTKL